MRLSRILPCFLLLFTASQLEAVKDKSILSGKIEMAPYPKDGVSVDLEIHRADESYLGQIHLSVDSTANHAFRERFPESWNGNKFIVRVEVGAPQGYVSKFPDYSWKKGQFLVLVLQERSEAFRGWLKAARRADRLEVAVKRLEALEDWNLQPADQLTVTTVKAASYGRWKDWRMQQELLREAYQPSEFQQIPQAAVAGYFKQRLAGFTKLVNGDFPAMLQVTDLRDLWEDLVSDFASQYSSCGLDAAVTATGDQLSPAVLAVQRKTLKTWLGRPGATVSDCPRSQTASTDLPQEIARSSNAP